LITQVSPELNGRLAHMFFEEMEKKVGLPLKDLVEPVRGRQVHYKDLASQPRRIHTTPMWGAILSDPETGKQRTFAPWTLNVERLKPWHTLTGRIEIYFDHQAILEMGEGLPTYKPPLDMVAIGDIRPDKAEAKSKIFRFITPHGKWQIHSSFRDHWPMMHMSRGGPTVWINPDDAREIEVQDNDWVELYCENGIQVCRAVVSHQVPRGMSIVYHQVERHVNVPFSPLAKKRGSSDLRGGHHPRQSIQRHVAVLALHHAIGQRGLARLVGGRGVEGTRTAPVAVARHQVLDLELPLDRFAHFTFLL
jgi:nitrate reductase alpha subunit